MWKARTKNDLMIEVWEKLDCESVGRVEIEAIEIAVAAHYGDAAVESPMTIARLLADEGAELRHSEIMELYLERASDRPYDAALRNVLDISDFRNTLFSIRRLENLRLKYKAENDKTGLRLVRDTAVKGKKEAARRADAEHIEIAQWLSVWLQTPEMFDSWVDLRQHSQDFIDKFGHIRDN